MQTTNCVLDILVREKELTTEINLDIDEYEYWIDKAVKNKASIDRENMCKKTAYKYLENINKNKKVLASLRRELAYTLKSYLD